MLDNVIMDKHSKAPASKCRPVQKFQCAQAIGLSEQSHTYLAVLLRNIQCMHFSYKIRLGPLHKLWHTGGG